MSRAARTKKERRGRVGIRWWLFACLALFTILILVSIWIFQVCLLSTFYEKEKFSDLKKSADELKEYVAAEDARNAIAKYAKEKNICILVIALEEEHGRLLASADATSDCIIHHVNAQTLEELYADAKQNGGTYNKRFEFNDESEAEGEGRFPGFPKKGSSVNAIHVRIVEGNGVEYVMLLDCELMPVDATVRTLQMQFVWIAGALLCCAFLLALLLSHIVAKPLVQITQKAEKLAGGEFKVDFSERDAYREVQELADALSFAAKEIGATGRLQRELIANISHDLRTPLTMIKGYSEMMRDIPGENSPENIQAVIDETTRLSDLVNDLLDLSKLQAGTTKPKLAVFDLTELLHDALDRYDTLIKHKGYRIESVVEENPVFVEADRTMILQVLYNLVGNAVNYTGESHRVLVTQTVKDGVVRLAVADDGEGIPPEQIPEIWDRYYRVDREHRCAVMGTGLGLSIVKNVMEAHKASYGVESAVGTGSVFWFELPVIKKEG
ncbi:MAG: HAMP domain-containing histidine kinase [Ruminococcaceae bacterium]|nr:HAMP domain-containing histidine kinase [Oscillospiraceae bacterium]